MSALARARAPETGVVGAAELERAAADRLLPVCAEMAGLFPRGGMRRGSTVAVRGSTAVLLKLLAAATANGSWAAVVGMSGLGLLAASELGVAVERLAVVAQAGGEPVAVVAALLDGMDLVVVNQGEARQRPLLPESQTRRLAARARSRGAVLIVRGRWPSADLELECARSRWTGLGSGHGYLRSRSLLVRAHGRGAAARPVSAEVTL
ncbi:MAG: hypothetical protein HOQ24_05115 [Mycobacteriaceae bacterium]|nr:hypothetical protein [Mycobacteriaceae bacterium]